MPLGTLGSNLSHDVVLTSSDGYTLGLMLASVEQVKKAWQVSEIPAPTGTRVSNIGAGLQDSPPEMAATVYRDDHSAGMGPSIILNDAKDYMTGNVMTSVVGKVIKPPFSQDISLPTSEGKVRCWGEFSSALYCSDGRYLHRSTNGSTFAQVLDTGVGNRVSSFVNYGNATGTSGIVIGVETDDTAETSVRYYYSTDGTTFAQANAGGGRLISHFFVVDKTLYGLTNPNTFVTTTDPFAAAATWGGTTSVGDQQHKFQL